MIEKLNTLMMILSALGLLRDGVKNYIDVSGENSLSNGMVDKLKDSYDNYTAILNKYAIEGKDFDVPSINRDYVIRKLRLIKTIVNRLVEYYINEPETLRDYKQSLYLIGADIDSIYRKSVVDYKTFLLAVK